METLLDGVAEGSVKWKTIVENFYPDLNEAVNKAEAELEKVQIADEETDVLAQTYESVEEKVTENHDDEVIEQAEKFEKSDETESKDDNNLQNTVVEEGDVITAEEERKSDAVVSTTSGNYEYFGAVDENGLRTGRGRTVSPIRP